MLAYDMKTKMWQNGTRDFSPFPTLLSATAHWVPSFGPNGLIFVFGAYSPPVGTDDSPGASAESPKLENITFFDPVTMKMYSQLSTGDIPPSPRMRFCVSGRQNTDGGYEVFLFGGIQQQDGFGYDDAYVLSLPGFAWTRLPFPPGGKRSEHTCVPVGNRQILSIGGTDQFGGGTAAKDPVPQGLLLFDMTDMKWSEFYNAEAAPYQRPTILKRWYDRGLLDDVIWSDNEVKKLFTADTQGKHSHFARRLDAVVPPG